MPSVLNSQLEAAAADFFSELGSQLNPATAKFCPKLGYCQGKHVDGDETCVSKYQVRRIRASG